MAEAVAALSLGVELFTGAFLLFAGIVKIRAGESAVVAAVGQYEVGSRDHQRQFARLLPGIEIGLGLCLVLGFGRDLTALGAGALLATFELAMARSLWSGRRHPCGCVAGRRSTLISWTLVWRNGVLVAALTAAELVRNASVPWTLANLALAAVFLAGTLSSIALHIRSRTPTGPAFSVAPTTSRT